MAEYFFPTPGSALRRLLDRKAKKREEFAEDEAIMDVMLALDRGDLRPQRFYMKRWGWSKGRTSRALSSKNDDNLQSKARRWRRFGQDEPTEDREKPPQTASQQANLAGRQRGAGGAPVGQERGAGGAQVGRKSASGQHGGGGLGRQRGAGGALVGQERGAGGAQVGQYSTEADTDTDNKTKQQQTAARESEGGRPREADPGSAAATSENLFGVGEDGKTVARQLYEAGVTNDADGQVGGAALKLVAGHGADACRRQLRNLSLRQSSGAGPDRPGAWLVKAIEDGYELPGEGSGGRPAQQKHSQQKHRGDGQRGAAPGPPAPQRQRGGRRKQRGTHTDPAPPEHQPGGAAGEEESGEQPSTDDLDDLLAGTFGKIEADRAAKAQRQRSDRKRGFEARRLRRFLDYVATGRFELEARDSGVLFERPAWER